jgi:hypothetical protein
MRSSNLADDRRRRVLHLPTDRFPQTGRRNRGDDQMNKMDLIALPDVGTQQMGSSYQEQIPN